MENNVNNVQNKIEQEEKANNTRKAANVKTIILMILVLLLVLVIGIGTGLLLSGKIGKENVNNDANNTSSTQTQENKQEQINNNETSSNNENAQKENNVQPVKLNEVSSKRNSTGSSWQLNLLRLV